MSSGHPHRILPISDNLRAAIWAAEDNPKAAIIYFQARETKEEVCFQITTTAPIISHTWRLPQLHGGQWLNMAEYRDSNHYGIYIDKAFLDIPFIIGVELDSDDPVKHIASAQLWDRSLSEPQIVYIEFPEAEQGAAANP